MEEKGSVFEISAGIFLCFRRGVSNRKAQRASSLLSAGVSHRMGGRERQISTCHPIGLLIFGSPAVRGRRAFFLCEWL